jgi:hypothetical protein
MTNFVGPLRGEEFLYYLRHLRVCEQGLWTLLLHCLHLATGDCDSEYYSRYERERGEREGAVAGRDAN